jgi:DNA polymerase-3 subunit delta
MIFFFYGEDSFRAKNKIDAIKDKFKASVDKSGISLINLDGEILTLDDFLKNTESQGFFTSKKLIIIKNIFDNKNLKILEKPLIEYLAKQKDSVEENYLIFWQVSKPNPKNLLYKALTKFKYVEEFPKLSSDKINTWLKKEIASRNKTISQEAALTLLSFVGENLWQLEQEINKLVHFSHNPEISLNDVKSIVQAKSDDNIFNLVDALGKKNKALALKLLESQLDSGANSLYLLTMIARQFRILIKVKLFSAKIDNSFAVAQALKIHPFVAKKTLEQSKLYSLEDLKKIYQLLLELDFKLKREASYEKVFFLQMIEQI